MNKTTSNLNLTTVFKKIERKLIKTQRRIISIFNRKENFSVYIKE